MANEYGNVINKVLNNLRAKLIKEIDENIEMVLLFCEGYFSANKMLNEQNDINIKELNVGLQRSKTNFR